MNCVNIIELGIDEVLMKLEELDMNLHNNLESIINYNFDLL